MSFDFEAHRDYLICPLSRAELVHDGESLVSRDSGTRLQFPIRDGIPCMLVDEATELPMDEWKVIMARHSDDRQSQDSQKQEKITEPNGEIP